MLKPRGGQQGNLMLDIHTRGFSICQASQNKNKLGTKNENKNM